MPFAASVVETASRVAEALRAVEALAEEYERHAGLMQAQADSTGVVDVISQSQAFSDAAASLRVALAPAAEGAGVEPAPG